MALLMAGCGGGSAEGAGSAEPETTTGQEAPPAPTLVARFSGFIVEGVPVIIELDDAGGGTVTYPAAGRSDTVSDCHGEGAVLTCRLSSEAHEGEIELTRRDGGADARARQTTDDVWVSFPVETTPL